MAGNRPRRLSFASPEGGAAWTSRRCWSRFTFWWTNGGRAGARRALVDSVVRPGSPKRKSSRLRSSRDGWPRFRGERDFFRFADAHLLGYFPNLVSHGQLNRRIRALELPWPDRCPVGRGGEVQSADGGYTGHVRVHALGQVRGRRLRAGRASRRDPLRRGRGPAVARGRTVACARSTFLPRDPVRGVPLTGRKERSQR